MGRVHNEATGDNKEYTKMIVIQITKKNGNPFFLYNRDNIHYYEKGITLRFSQLISKTVIRSYILINRAIRQPSCRCVVQSLKYCAYIPIGQVRVICAVSMTVNSPACNADEVLIPIVHDPQVSPIPSKLPVVIIQVKIFLPIDNQNKMIRVVVENDDRCR